MKRSVYILLTALTWSLSSAAQTANEAGSGNCLRFDGSNDYVSIPHSSSLNISSAITVEGWINIGSGSGNDRDWIYKNVGTNVFLNGFRFEVTGTNVKFSVGVGSGTSTNANGNVPLNEWHHVAGVYDGTNVILYIDGVLAQSKVAVGLGTNSSPLIIGSFIDNGTFFNGRIDEVRVWNRALSASEVRDYMCQELTGNESNLAGYWRMDEGADNLCTSGQDVCDASGNGNHGTKF